MSDRDILRVSSPEDAPSEYRRILVREVNNHRLFARVTVITSLGLIGFGSALANYSFATIGYLLVIVGALRFLNTFYDLQREDKLKREMRRIEKMFSSRAWDSPGTATPL